MNAFTHKSRVRLHEMANIRVYNIISRVNHSCRPNAVAEWNGDLGMGTLHALVEIKDTDGIMIDYLTAAEDRLSTIAVRRTALMRNYDFVCVCVACGPEGALADVKKRQGKNEEDTAAIEKSEDNQRLRAQAKKLLKQIKFDDIKLSFEPREITQDIEDERTRQLELLRDYIAAIKRLGLSDFKLANAYKARGLHPSRESALQSTSVAIPEKPRPPFRIAPRLNCSHWLWRSGGAIRWLL